MSKKYTFLTALTAAAVLAAPLAAGARGDGDGNHRGGGGDSRGHYNRSSDDNDRQRNQSQRSSNGQKNGHSKQNSQKNFGQSRAAENRQGPKSNNFGNDDHQTNPSPAATPGAHGFFTQRGAISGVTATSFVVNGQTITIDPDKTRIVGGPLADGQTVLLFGVVAENGQLVAKGVVVKHAVGAVHPVGHVKLTGTIASVDATTIVVGGQTYVINGDTDIKHGPLAAGQLVKVEGYLNSDGTLVARKIKVKQGASENETPEPTPSPTASPGTDPSASPSPEPTVSPSASPSPEVSPTPSPTASPTPAEVGKFQVRGEITSLTDTAIVVNGQTFVIDEDTRIRGDLAVGQTVRIKGVILADGTFVADKVNKGKHHWLKFWHWFR